MQSTLSTDELVAAKGTDVYAADGDKIGSVEEIYVDQETGSPEWIGIGAGFFGTKRVLVPVEGAELREDGFYVQYPKDQVKDSPDIDEDEISSETEQELYAYYGVGGQAGAASSERRGSTDEAEIVRSEEELQVGKRDVEAGRARLRKWVETEPVETDVQLKRETVSVEREAIDEPVSGAEIGEEEVEVPVHREEAVVQKEAVAKERVGLKKDVETKQEKVSDELRKERVEVEGEEDSER